MYFNILYQLITIHGKIKTVCLCIVRCNVFITMNFNIILFVVFALVGKSYCNTPLRCYACGFSSSDSDRSCLTITDTTHTVECPYTYCTILRQEYLDPSGVVVSFVRGCEEQPDYLNHEVSDTTFRTYYRACTSSLCNIGDGVQSIVAGNLSPTQVYNGENLLVPGTGSSASVIKFSAAIILLSFVILFC